MFVGMNRHSDEAGDSNPASLKVPEDSAGGRKGLLPNSALAHKKQRPKAWAKLTPHPARTLYVTVPAKSGRWKMTTRTSKPTRDLVFVVEERLRSGEQQLRRTARALAEVLERTDQGLEASPEVARSVQASENRWRAIAKEYGLLDSGSVAALLGGSARNRNMAHQLAKEGKILGVKRGRGTLYPGFEFDHGEVQPVIAEVVAIGRRNEWSDSHLLLWLASPNGYLEGRIPARMMDEPGKILEAARQDLAERW